MIYSDKVEARLAADTNMFSCNIALKVVLVIYKGFILSRYFDTASK